MPKTAATTQPTPMLMSADQTRHMPDARRVSAADTASVTAATTGPDAWDLPSDTSASRSNTTGAMVTATSMSTVPDTTGVMMRLIRGSHAATANWKSDETTRRVASRAGPPSDTAAAVIATNWMVGPVTTVSPHPRRHNRTAWIVVTTALMMNAAKTAHVR